MNISGKARLESDAEHIYSMQMLANYIMEKEDLNLDRAKVYEMILCHELGELDAGDVTPVDDVNREERYKSELTGVKRLSTQYNMPRYLMLWEEFEKRETAEAKFVYAMDKLDVVLMAKEYAKVTKNDALFEELFATNGKHCEQYLKYFNL